MRAIVQDRFGPPDVLQLADAGRPEAGADDVLVRVRAAALNPADWHILRGDPLVARLMGVGLTKPKARVAGIDAAGVVERVGANVRGVRKGEEVLGFCRGAFAEYACAAAGLVVPKPAGLTFEQAAAVPVAATTALRGIRDVGQVKAGQQVLVNGAGGGVGTYAVQIAAALGAEVTGVCSTRNAELVRSIGAGHVVELHEGGLHRRAVALRRDPRQCQQPPARPAAPGARPEGDPGAQRRRLARPRVRARRWPPAGSGGQHVRLTAAAPATVPAEPGGTARSDRAHRGRQAVCRSSTRPTRWLTRPRACAPWSKGTPAARSSSP